MSVQEGMDGLPEPQAGAFRGAPIVRACGSPHCANKASAPPLVPNQHRFYFMQTDDPKTGIIGLFIQGATSITIGAKRLRFVPIINAYDPTSSLQPRPRRLIFTPSPEAAG